MSSTPDIDAAFELSLKLSRLTVDSAKRAQLSADLGNILGYVAAIDAVDTEELAPLLSPLELSARDPTPQRPDQTGAAGAAIQQPAVPGEDSDNLYIVPQIIARDD